MKRPAMELNLDTAPLAICLTCSMSCLACTGMHWWAGRGTTGTAASVHSVDSTRMCLWAGRGTTSTAAATVSGIAAATVSALTRQHKNVFVGRQRHNMQGSYTLVRSVDSTRTCLRARRGTIGTAAVSISTLSTTHPVSTHTFHRVTARFHHLPTTSML